MPQIFTSGMLYAFLIFLVFCLVWIGFKIRTIQKEAPMDRPVIKVAPLPKAEEAEEDEQGSDPALEKPDDLIARSC